MNSVASQMAQLTMETLYKDTRDTKLGITFFRRDPQDSASPDSAIISRIGATGPAAGKLNVGERIMTVQGVRVEGPLHAARMLRESEGYMKIGKLPKQPDFDANLEKYQQIEAEAARAAMAATLPGQTTVSTPRTDQPTPRGPGMSSVPTGFGSGLRVLNQPGGASGAPPSLNMNAIGDNLQTAGAQLSARTQELQAGMQQNLGQLSARMGNFFSKVGGLGEFVPTQQNKELRAARKIQKAWRGYAARGRFHEERGAVLMLQAAQRRVKAQKVLQYKKSLKYWAAVVIQERWRRYQLRKAVKGVGGKGGKSATPKKEGIGSKIVKSLSFSRRSGKKSIKDLKPVMPDDLAPEDLISARGANPNPPMNLGKPLESSGEPTGGAVKKRSLSFMRRKKAAEAAGETAVV